MMSAATARNAEPTMEDILASIRKIISDDLEGGVARTTSDDQSASSADIYDLTDQVAFQAQKDVALLSPLGAADQRIDAVSERAEAQQIVSDPVAVVTELAARMRSAVEAARPDRVERAVQAPVEAPPVPEKTLSLSPNVQNSIASALETLRQVPVTPPAPSPEAVDTVLRSIVESALRPVLGQWLDANLPGIVERLVKAEIERIARER
jgi:cell pole-organizing protein PopZ